MGNVMRTNSGPQTIITNTASSDPITLKIHYMHADWGVSLVNLNPSQTVQTVVSRCSFPFQTLHETRLIINGQLTSPSSIVSKFLNPKQTTLKAVMICKYGNPWIRYKCINCGYYGSIDYHYSGNSSIKYSVSTLFCRKCRYKLPSPLDQFELPFTANPIINSLQTSLKTINSISPIFYELNIPTNVIQCLIGYCVGNVDVSVYNGDCQIHKDNYYYCLIYNPFKRYDYEWTPIRITSHSNDCTDIVSVDLGNIRTNVNHEYNASKWMNKQHFDNNSICGLEESFKQSKVYIGTQTVVWNKKSNLNVQMSQNIIEVEISTLTGKKIIVSVDLDYMSVMDLKRIVQDKEGIPPEIQRFINYGGRGMGPDDRTLRSYGLFQGCPLRLVLRLRGG